MIVFDSFHLKTKASHHFLLVVVSHADTFGFYLRHLRHNKAAAWIPLISEPATLKNKETTMKQTSAWFPSIIHSRSILCWIEARVQGEIRWQRRDGKEISSLSIGSNVSSPRAEKIPSSFDLYCSGSEALKFQRWTNKMKTDCGETSGFLLRRDKICCNAARN